MKTKSIVLVLAILTLGTVAFAHHGSASYAMQPTTLKDVTVTRVNWGNPHTLLLFDVKDAKGNMQHWVAEANAASVGYRLRRVGVKLKTSFGVPAVRK